MFTHTHDGVPCQQDGCALDRDKPARLRDEHLTELVRTHDPRDDLFDQLHRIGEQVECARIAATRSIIDGREGPDDIAIPLRLVVTSDGVVLRCTHRTMLKSGPVTCNEEWAMHHIGPAEFTEAISHALGHVSIEHRP